MPDYVGTHENGEKVLYDSIACAQKAGAVEIRKLDPDEYETQDWGALCPVCEKQYNNF